MSSGRSLKKTEKPSLEVELATVRLVLLTYSLKFTSDILPRCLN